MRDASYVQGDTSVVARCRAGDPGAWPELVQRFSPYVYSITTRAYRLREKDAEDVFQEVFLRTWQHLEGLRDDAAIRPWIGQLTRRLCVDRLRTNAREQARAELEVPTGPADDFALVDESLTVRDAIAQLPAIHRDIVERFFVHGESQAAIASSLGIAEGTVASRISRARDTLRTQLAA
jgi:RNA polymerase sigma-70 factor (ECF subfamily)